jgi:hypothetical protein
VAHPHEDLVRGAFAASGRGGIGALRDQYFADGIRLHYPGRSPLAGDYDGVAQVLGFFGRAVELSGGTFRTELHDVVANDEHAVALFTARADRPTSGWQTASSRSSTSAMARRPRPGFIRLTSTPAMSSGPDTPATSSVSGNAIDRSCFRILNLNCDVRFADVRGRT